LQQRHFFQGRSRHIYIFPYFHTAVSALYRPVIVQRDGGGQERPAHRQGLLHVCVHQQWRREWRLSRCRSSLRPPTTSTIAVHVAVDLPSPFGVTSLV
jgi:hypothetical protein